MSKRKQRKSEKVWIAGPLPEGLHQLVNAVLRKSRLQRREKRRAEKAFRHELNRRLAAGEGADVILASYEQPREQRKQGKRLRRNARRKRFLTWHLWIWGWRACLSMIPCYLLFWLYLMTGEIRPEVDYVAPINATVVTEPASELAWPIYRAAANKYDFTAFEVEHVFDQPVTAKALWDLSDDKAAEIRQVIAPHQAFLDEIRRGAKRKHMGLKLHQHLWSYGIEDAKALFSKREVAGIEDARIEREVNESLGIQFIEDNLYFLYMPRIAWLRQASMLLSLDNKLAKRERDYDRLIGNLDTMIAVARHLRELNFLLNDLVSISTIKFAFLDMIQLAEHADLDIKTIDRLSGLLENTDDFGRSRASNEKNLMKDFYQRFYSTNGFVNQKSALFIYMLTADNVLTHEEKLSNLRFGRLYLPIMAAVVATRGEAERVHDQIWDELKVYNQKPLWKRAHLPDPIETHTEALKLSRINRFRHFHTALLVPALGRAKMTNDALIAIREALRLILAIEKYHAEKGQYPHDAQALIPAYLPRIPIDYTTGKPLIYRLMEGVPTVYGLGWDLDDDMAISFQENRDYWPSLLPAPQVEEGDWVVIPRPDVVDTESE